jgi:hypothetical protein
MSVNITSMQASSQTQGRALTTDNASPKTGDNAHAPLQKLQRTVVQLQQQVQTLQLSASPATSKNDVGAGSVEMQTPAVKRRRRKRSRMEDSDANTADTNSWMPQARTTAPQHPQPPTPNHASGNGRNAKQQHGGPAQTRDNAQQQQDGRWRQDRAKVEGQAAPGWGGQGQGQGRGPAPWKGKPNTARTAYREWMTLPLDTLVESKFLGMSLQQLELRSSDELATLSTKSLIRNTQRTRCSPLTS